MGIDTRLLTGTATFAAVVEAGGFKRAGEVLGSPASAGQLPDLRPTLACAYSSATLER
jgi:hypothetical protein